MKTRVHKRDRVKTTTYSIYRKDAKELHRIARALGLTLPAAVGLLIREHGSKLLDGERGNLLSQKREIEDRLKQLEGVQNGNGNGQH